MQTGRGGHWTSLTRLAVTAAILLFIAGSGQALAQTVVRIEPVPVLFPSAGGQTVFEIWVDGIPSAGLGSFDLRLEENDPGQIFGECLTFVRVTRDPALLAAWGGGGSNNASATNNILRWQAAGFQSALPGPSGTILLGTVTYQANINQGCQVGTQSNFTWRNTTTEKPLWGSGVSPNTEFGTRQGSPWNIGPLQDRDLTVTCTRLFDPNDILAQVDPNDPLTPLDPNEFVDGAPLDISCDVTNQGTVNVGLTTMVAVFSNDTVVNSADQSREIGRTTQFAVNSGATVNRVISIRPDFQFRTAGPTNVCVKTDVNTGDFNDVDGLVLETDEANNTDCFPIEVLPWRADLRIDPDPNATFAVPSPLDPNAFRAGLLLEAHFDVQNRGIGAIRSSYGTEVLLATSLAAALADPNGTRICSKGVNFQIGQFQKGKTDRSLVYGFDAFPEDPAVPPPNEVCQIPFSLAPGAYSLVIQADPTNNVVEQTPGGNSAEGNNALEIPITVGAPLPPQFRVRDAEQSLTQTRIRVFDDDDPTNNLKNPREVGVTLISAQDVAGLSWRLNWSPANLVTVDPNNVVFTDFLEQNGRVQTCQVDMVDNTAGFVAASCTTAPGADPNATNAGATTPGSAILAQVPLTANFPGTGTLTLTNLALEDSAGQPITGFTTANGTVEVSGIPRMRVTNAVPPPMTYPGADFQTSYDLENRGFGRRNTPIFSRLVISQDATTDPNVVAPDVVACQFNESMPIPAFDTRSKMVTCRLDRDFRPGQYTGFYQVSVFSDPNSLNRQDVTAFPINARVATLRKLGRKKVLETFAEPDMLGGTTGPRLANARRFNAKSMAAVKSARRNLNWLVGMKRGKNKKILTVQALPKGANDRLRILTKLRLPGEDKRILGSIDIDADGEDELMLLQKTKSGGEQIDFRRIDFTERRPLPCQSAAETEPNFFPADIVAATGIDADTDPNTFRDDLVVLTADGVLHVYDITLQGSIPPPDPCKAIPTVILPPGDAILVETASDPAFSVPGDEVISLCAIDAQLDGIQELVSLHVNSVGDQALRVSDLPMAPMGSATVILDDPAFGGKGKTNGGRALTITCTR